jgi:putative transposase
VGHVPDKCGADDAAWREAVVREAVIRKLVAIDRPTRADFLSACRELDVKRARLYQLIKAYRERPVTSSLLGALAGTPRGKRYLSTDIEAVVADALGSFYKSRQKPSINRLHHEVQRRCRARQLKAPSWHTLRTRITAIDPAELARAREGTKAARDQFRPVPRQYVAQRAFEVVQIDQTKVDLIIVDREHRRPLQRPWLTLGIDVASRMVAGFYLTLEAPSAVSVALAIQHIVQPKDEWLRGLGIKAAWPTSGFPDAIHVDNAKEFRSRALQRGTEEYGIALIRRPVATPHYGGHIERLIGTMMGSVHLLPGTTFSNVEERGDYDSTAKATMTLDELERWLGLEIARYHAEQHRSVGIPPLAAWHDAVARRAQPLRQPYDLNSFMIDFLPSVDRLVRRDGIHLFSIRYWDDVLSIWAGRLDRQLRISYDPRDLSTVFVQDPDGTRWPIRYANLQRPPITLGEHRRAQLLLKERGLAFVDEQLIFETIERQRAIVDDAVRDTKLARRLAERRDRAITGAARGRSQLEADAPDSLQGAAHPLNVEPETVFPVEEWS